MLVARSITAFPETTVTASDVCDRSGTCPPPEPSGRCFPGLRWVLRSRSYLPLWLGQLLCGFGDTLHYIALVVLVFPLTGHGLPVAGLVAAKILPVLVLGPIARVIIDRFSRKAVLVAVD